MSRQARYMRQRSGHGQYEYTDDQFSRDAVHMLPNNTCRFYWTYTGHNGLFITLTGNICKQSKYTEYSGSAK